MSNIRMVNKLLNSSTFLYLPSVIFLFYLSLVVSIVSNDFTFKTDNPFANSPTFDKVFINISLPPFVALMNCQCVLHINLLFPGG